MSDFFGKIKTGAGKVTFEAEKMNRTNKAKSELEHLKKQAMELYLKLGQQFYAQRQTPGGTSSTFDDECAAIDALEQQITAKDSEIKQIAAEEYQAPAAATTKFCGNCGQEVATAVKFCPNCGAKV